MTYRDKAAEWLGRLTEAEASAIQQPEEAVTAFAAHLDSMQESPSSERLSAIVDQNWLGNNGTYRELLQEVAEAFERACGNKMIGQLTLRGPGGDVDVYAGSGNMIEDLLQSIPEPSDDAPGAGPLAVVVEGYGGRIAQVIDEYGRYLQVLRAAGGDHIR